MGFSADWLALREPADRAARDTRLLQQAARLAGESPVILDLGCGTGSTVRAFSGLLPATAEWRLVDSDPVLLDQAAMQSGSKTQTCLMDLTAIDALPLDGVTLVTASALLDLVSEAWITAFAARLNVPCYAALSYDGVMRWSPSDPFDQEVTTQFNAHQCSDKGFGPALGPAAATRTGEILVSAGFSVESADSPWRLGPDMAQLQDELLDGIALAAFEAGSKNANEWRQSRHDVVHKTNCVIGHIDLLAVPGTPMLEKS